MSIKQKTGLLLTAVLSFCLACQVTLCTTFQTFRKRKLSQVSCLPYFLPPNHFYTTPASPTTNCFHLEYAKAHLVWCHSGPYWTHFLAEHWTLCSRLLPLLWKELPWLDRFFPCSRGRSFLLEDSRHVTVVLMLRLWGQFQVELPFRCHLKHSTGVRLHPCFCQLVCRCLPFCPFPSFFFTSHTSKVDRTMLDGEFEKNSSSTRCLTAFGLPNGSSRW